MQQYENSNKNNFELLKKMGSEPIKSEKCFGNISSYFIKRYGFN